MNTRPTYEKSGLTDTSGVDGYGAKLVQKPLAPWFVLLFCIVFLGVCAGISMDDPGAPVSPVTQTVLAAVVLVPFGVILLGSFYRSRVRIASNATELHLSGWIGRFPVPRTVVLPLDSLRCTARRGVALNGRRTFSLTLRAEGQQLRVAGLACTEREVDRVAADLESLGKRARGRIGEGAAEIPDALEVLVSERARSEQDTT